MLILYTVATHHVYGSRLTATTAPLVLHADLVWCLGELLLRLCLAARGVSALGRIAASACLAAPVRC